VTEYGLTITGSILFLFCLYSFLSIFEKYKKIPKSKKGNEKWTFLEMSKFGKPKKVSKNTVFSRCDQYAVNYFFGLKNLRAYFFEKSIQNV
jgi:hypothetical protein